MTLPALPESSLLENVEALGGRAWRATRDTWVNLILWVNTGGRFEEPALPDGWQQGDALPPVSYVPGPHLPLRLSDGIPGASDAGGILQGGYDERPTWVHRINRPVRSGQCLFVGTGGDHAPIPDIVGSGKILAHPPVPLDAGDLTGDLARDIAEHSRVIFWEPLRSMWERKYGLGLGRKTDDTWFRAVPRVLWDAILGELKLYNFRYEKDFRDCDEFAMALKAMASLRWGVNGSAVVSGGLQLPVCHKYNCAVLAENGGYGLEMVEPQQTPGHWWVDHRMTGDESSAFSLAAGGGAEF